MEPTDIDKLLRTKLQETSDVHQHEMEAAKPFIWSAVQKNISKGHSLRWYHLAAAVILLLTFFTFVLQNVQKSHEKEMILLSDKIDQLQQNYTSQETALKTKDQELGSLSNELKNVELRLTDLQQQKPQASKAAIVYRTDTVIVKQIEYVRRETNPVIAMETDKNPEKNNESIDLITKKSDNINYAIYPSVARQSKNQKSETIKVKFLKASRN